MTAKMTPTMKILLVDNYDSYTGNIRQACFPHECTMIRNDGCSWSTLKSQLNHFDAILLSPGPGSPKEPKDIGVCAPLLLEANFPILGICLGHQALAHLNDCPTVLAPEPVHGQLSPVYHAHDPLFEGIPSPFSVVRYHSLCVSDKAYNSDKLNVIAWMNDKERPPMIMSIKHTQKPIWGVQFHPESICTQYGQRLIHNFLKLAMEHKIQIPKPLEPLNLPMVLPPIHPTFASNPISIKIKKVYEGLENIEALFHHFEQKHSIGFWLDSARPTLDQKDPSSYMGFWNEWILEYYSHRHQITIRQLSTGQCQKITLPESMTIFDYLSEKCPRHVTTLAPFEFVGGLMGYFGYELEKETLKTKVRHSSPHADASFFIVDRCLAIYKNDVYLVACDLSGLFGDLIPIGQRFENSDDWMSQIQAEIATIQFHSTPNSSLKKQRRWICRDTLSSYTEKVKMAQDKITRGETYEVCLTTQFETQLDDTESMAQLYLNLRRSNPAPYAGYFAFPNLSILSSSPELFLKMDQSGKLTMKPIKGTAKRCLKNQAMDQVIAKQLQEDVKNRAENLMIVDLIRNDLSHVCEENSVRVPKLMHVETFATVHQLVTTVEGQLRKDLTIMDALSYSFPPGSMTGAPKRRTCDIIDQLESGYRGIYSGIMGFVSYPQSIWNVVIRTMVYDHATHKLTVGAGGAIIILSDPEEEYQEMLLKAQAVLNSI